MKKIFCLVAVLMLVSACDDGDMDLKTFDFSNQPNPTPCTDNNNDSETATEIYYKINGTEGLILELPKGALINSPTKDPVTGVNTPRTLVLGGANKLTYQNYVSEPTGLCIAADIPKAIETWIGDGTLLVTTVATKKTIDGVEKLTGYVHTITVEDVSFKLDGQTITVVNSVFGDITKENGFTFNFNPEGGTEPVVKTCEPGASPLYTLKNTETLTINIADFGNMFQNVVGTEDYNIEEEVLEILFNVYESSASTANVCGQGSQVPSQPIQKWFAVDTANEIGKLIVVTSETGGIYSHKIYLKNVSFANSLGGTFNLDDIVPTTDNGYYFGSYQE